MFGDALGQAEAYAALLASEGTLRGLIGPRELPRLWERHLLNCAVVGDVVGHGLELADVGSGAGLPGLVLAIARPDLHVTLIEPMLRRSTFLTEAVDRLALPHVEVVRARAEEVAGRRTFDVVTARAVAPLDRLGGWCLPLARGGGEVVAMKGSSASEEIAAAATTLRRCGATSWSVEQLGLGVVDPTVTVVRIQKAGGPRR